MKPIDRSLFFGTVRSLLGPLKQRQVDAMNDILDFMEADDKLTDSRWAAYIWATTWHETAKTCLPIEEYGKGRGHSYGLPAGPFGQRYYGRGFTQLTWARNYELLGEKLGLKLLEHPELALVPQHAYDIMSLGMREGLFTGKKLATYINGGRCDFVGARRIINGLDRAELIGGYAATFARAVDAKAEDYDDSPPGVA